MGEIKEKRCSDLPFSDVKNSRRSHHHRDQTGFRTRRDSRSFTRRQTGLRNMLKAPIPIVIIVRAKLSGTLSQFVPRDTIERHTHVMFARDPRDHFGLNGIKAIFLLYGMRQHLIS